jgi:hypothetical protein
MRLGYVVDGGERRVWFAYGTITTLDDAAWLEVPNVSHGNHLLEVFGTIAGETTGPDVATLTFWNKPCESEGEGAAVCSLGGGGAGAAGTGSGTALVGAGSA